MKVKDLESRQLSYLRGVCGLNKMDGESNESVYGRFGMSFKREGMNCGVVEVAKHNILNPYVAGQML